MRNDIQVGKRCRVSKVKKAVLETKRNKAKINQKEIPKLKTRLMQTYVHASNF
jgi:hypothetical protein